jgi:hypothetical protein
MPRELSNRELVEEFSKRGAFKAIEHFVDTGAITKEQAAVYVRAIYDYFLRQVQEAQREVRRLHAVLGRLVVLCDQGRRTKTWAPRDPVVGKLAQEIGALDGWVMSLYETDLTMVDFGAPSRGKDKASEFAASYDALRRKRIAELDFKIKDPSLFIIN